MLNYKFICDNSGMYKSIGQSPEFVASSISVSGYSGSFNINGALLRCCA